MFDSGLFSYLPNIKDKLNSFSIDSLVTETFITQQHPASASSSPHIIDKLVGICENLTSSTSTTPPIPPEFPNTILQNYLPILNTLVNSVFKNFEYYYQKLIPKISNSFKSFKKISIFSILFLLSIYILLPTVFKNSKMFSSSNSKRPDKYTTGLINMTTDCFANSTLQALASLNGLNDYLNKLIKFHSIVSIIVSSAPTDTDENVEAQKLLTSTFPSLSLHYGLIDILSKLQETIYTSRVISVWDFLHILEKIYNSRISRNQHDAHELLQLILETLEKEHLSLKLFILKNSKFLLNYKIQSISQSESTSESLFINFKKLVESLPIFPFTSELESYFKCLKCGGVSSKNYNPMTILSLAVPQESYISLDSLLKRNESELIDDYSCLKCKLKFILNQLISNSNNDPDNKNEDLIATLKNLINDQNVLINDDLSNIISNNNNNEIYNSNLLSEIENFKIDASSKKLLKSTINKKTSLITPPKLLTVHLSRSIYLSSQAMRNSCQVEFNGSLELVIDEVIRKDYKSHVYGKEIEFINDISNKNNSNKKNLELIRQARTFQDDDMNNSHSNFNSSESIDTNENAIVDITDSSKASLALDSTADADDESIKKLTAELESKVKINTGKSLAFQEKPEDEFVDGSDNNKLMKSLNNSDDDDEEVDYKSSDEENDSDEDDDSKSPPLQNVVPPDDDDDVDIDDEHDYDNIKLEVKNSSSNSTPESETTKSKSTVDTLSSQETNQTSLPNSLQNIPKTVEPTLQPQHHQQQQQQQSQSQIKELKKYNYKLRAVVRHQGSHQLGHYECYRRKPIYYKNSSNNEYYRKQIELIDPKLVRSQVMIQMNNGTLNSSNISDPIDFSETDLEKIKRKTIAETNNSEPINLNTNVITSGSDTEHHQGLSINTHFDSGSRDLQSNLSPTAAVISDISEKSEWKMSPSPSINNKTDDTPDTSNTNNTASTEIKRKSSISERIRSRVSSLVGGSRPRLSSISDPSTSGSPPSVNSPLSELHHQSGNSNPSFNSPSPPLTSSFSLSRRNRSGSTSHRRASISSPQTGVRKPVHSAQDKKLGSSVKHPFWRISDSKITEYTGLDVFADSKAVYMLFFEREG
ncbi:hypothetical protein B5S33_g2745 [[Candida] boidinii]|nr:hypothetical protein B5S30_g2834 [[Candida] boidinii]OWB84108.1 hypothetical protein B5S33_g2745 [[Candida] boidinii]